MADSVIQYAHYTEHIIFRNVAEIVKSAKQSYGILCWIDDTIVQHLHVAQQGIGMRGDVA